MAVPPQIRRKWFKEASVYQIYPASFKDSNGDGVGDIPGIISELDYIKRLGVDIVWLSPILASPQVDMGYDIADYRDIYPPYGTMADHDALIKGLHDRGMKYILDLVVNHTSSEHEWFKESKKSKNNKYRDWYIWRPAKYDSSKQRQPPNNWKNYFGGSAWEWDDLTKEYYLHLFAVEQPDLNWENPNVVSAVHEIIRFWLDRGVDGFRMDVINFISKAHGLPDAPIKDPRSDLQWGTSLYACGPRMHEFFQGMGAIMNEYDAFTVGEMPGCNDVAELLKAVGADRGELNMAFQFEVVSIDSQFESSGEDFLVESTYQVSVSMDTAAGDKFAPRRWKLAELKSIVNKWNKFMIDNGGWNALYLENHDQGRSISRYASEDPRWRALSGKMLATHLTFQSGTVFVYQGQELAQINMPKGWGLDKYRDIECINHWKNLCEAHPDDVALKKRTLEQYRLVSRDNARTPMQWSKAANAGFTPEGLLPWMDVHPDFEDWNVENQKEDPKSNYSYWSQALKLRREFKDIFIYGDFALVDEPHEAIFAYARTYDEKNAALVVTNFSDMEVEWTVPDEAMVFLHGDILLRNYEDGPLDKYRMITVRPWEAFVIVVKEQV